MNNKLKISIIVGGGGKLSILFIAILFISVRVTFLVWLLNWPLLNGHT